MIKKTDQKAINAFNRRMFLKYSTGAAAVAATSTLSSPAVHAQNRTVKIGFVSPQTGLVGVIMSQNQPPPASPWPGSFGVFIAPAFAFLGA